MAQTAALQASNLNGDSRGLTRVWYELAGDAGHPLAELTPKKKYGRGE
jgi:hypothetical protein